MTPEELKEGMESFFSEPISPKPEPYGWHTRAFYEKFPEEVSKEELDEAEKREDRFIKNLYGINLYLYPLPASLFGQLNSIKHPTSKPETGDIPRLGRIYPFLT